MRLAWKLFRLRHDYPRNSFNSIGRACFSRCLKEAWRQTNEARRFAALSAEERAEQIADLEYEIWREQHNDHWPSASRNIDALRAQLRFLSSVPAQQIGG